MYNVGVNSYSSSNVMGPERALSVVFMGSHSTCTPGTLLHIKKGGSDIIQIKRPAFFSNDYKLSTTSNTYTLGGAFGSHGGGSSFFGISLVWDGVSSGATICVFTSKGGTPF